MNAHTWLNSALLAFCGVAAAEGLQAARTSDYGSEQVTNICSDKTYPMAAYYGCLDDKRNQERQILDAAVDRVIDEARAPQLPQDYAADISRAQQNWLSWMESECSLEGLIDGGSTDSPWVDRCELRMMGDRLATIQSLQGTLASLISPPHRRQSSGK